MKDDPGRGTGGVEHALEDAAVKVQVFIQGGTEAVDENRRPEAGRSVATGTMCAQAAFHRAHQDAPDHTLHGRIVLQEMAQALRHGEDHRSACLVFRFAASSCRTGRGGKT